MNYDHKQAVSEALSTVPDRFIYIRLKRGGDTLVHCKVRRYGGDSKESGEKLLHQQFGAHAVIRWTAEDHADVEV